MDSFVQLYTELDYTRIIYSYYSIIEWTDESFVNYTNDYFDNINDTIYSLIDEYKELLYKYVKGYNYTIDSNIFENYFQNISNTIQKKFDDIIDNFTKINATSDIISKYTSHLKKNITSLLNEKKDYFNEMIKDEDSEIEAFGNKFLLKDYFLNKISMFDELMESEINFMVTSDYPQIINEFNKSISIFTYPIKTLFKNVTDQFLVDFQKGKNKMTVFDKLSLYATYYSYGLNKNNENRNCWNLRGRYLTDLKKEDQINYNNYLQYNNTKMTIEECKVNQTSECPYDYLSDIEEVEFINQTELYYQCKNKKRLFNKKQSCFQSLNDFDIEKINKISNKLLKILDELIPSEYFITNYLYKNYYVNYYKLFTKNDFNLNSASLKNETENYMNNLEKEYNTLVSEFLIDNIHNVFQDFEKESEFKIKASLTLFYNMKNKLIIKYYYQKYKDQKELYRQFLSDQKHISPLLNFTLNNIFDNILIGQNEFTTNLKDKINKKIVTYYRNQFDKIITNYYFNFTKQKLINKYKIPYFENNIDDILNLTEYDSRFSEEINNIINNLIENYNISDDNELYIPIEYSHQTNNYLEQILSNISFIEYNENKSELYNGYQEIKNNFLNNFSLVYEKNNDLKKIDDFVNRTIYTIYDVGELKKINNKIINDLNLDIEYPNLFSIAYNKSIGFYKKNYNVTYEILKRFFELTKNYYKRFADIVDNKVGSFLGYTMIDGLNYLDTPDQLSSYAINISSLIEETNNDNGRRLTESKYSKEIRDIKEALKEVKKEILLTNKNNPNFKYENINFTNSKRKLEKSYTSKYDNYNQHSPARTQTDIDVELSNLNSEIDRFNELFYYYINNFATKLKNKFSDELEVLNKKYENFCSVLKNKLSKDNYDNITSHLTMHMNAITTYVYNTTNLIKSLSDQFTDTFIDIYVAHKSMGSSISHKINNYYFTLDYLISHRYKTLDEKEYKSKIRNLASEDTYNSNKYIFTESAKKQKKAEDEKDSSIYKYEPPEPTGYEWDDEDSYNSKSKGEEGMYKNKIKIAQKKDEDAKAEEKKSETRKRLEKYQKKLDDYHVKLETEIKFDITDLSNTEINTNLGWEYMKELKAGIQMPITFPLIPVIEFRFGFKFAFFIKIKALLVISFKFSDYSLAIYLNFEVSGGLKLDVVGEIGIGCWLARFYGGISGTLVEAKVGITFNIHLNKNQLDLHITLTVYTLKFRVYVETEVKLVFYTIKKVFFEKEFGIKEPVLEAYYYIIFNWYGEKLASDKGFK